MENTYKKPEPQGTCESCLNYEYDEEYDCYTCIMDLDQDDLYSFVTGNTRYCPFYRFGDEYLIVHKQI